MTEGAQDKSDLLSEKCSRLQRVCQVCSEGSTCVQFCPLAFLLSIKKSARVCVAMRESVGPRRSAFGGMQAQLSQIRALEAVSKETDAKRTAYEDVTLQVKKLWDTLCDDIELLHSHAVRDLVCPSHLASRHAWLL